MAVDVREDGDRLELGLPRPLFHAGVSNPIYDEYAVTKDGQRFLVITPAEERVWRFNTILNWTELLD